MLGPTCPVPEQKVASHLDVVPHLNFIFRLIMHKLKKKKKKKKTRTDCSVQPRLVTIAVGEPTVRTADGNIENKVER